MRDSRDGELLSVRGRNTGSLSEGHSLLHGRFFVVGINPLCTVGGASFDAFVVLVSPTRVIASF